jgi:hypothetical protein
MAKAREPALHTIGDEVEFTTEGGKDWILPKRLWLVQDRAGVLLPRCDVYVLKARESTEPLTEERRRWALRYYGTQAHISNLAFSLPKSPFRRLATVVEVRYRRGADGEYFHPLDPPVTLYRTASGSAYRMNLPEGCEVNDRGFIYP